MRPAQRAARLLAQPVSDLPERLESERYPKGSPPEDDASGSRYVEDPFTVDPKLPGDKGRSSYIVAQEARAQGPARFITEDELRAQVTPEVREQHNRMDAVCRRIADRYRTEPWFGGLGLLFVPKPGEDQVVLMVDASAPANIRDVRVNGIPVKVDRRDLHRDAGLRRRGFDQPRTDAGTGDEPIHTLTEDGDQESKESTRFQGLAQMFAWRCAQCQTAVRTAKCMCPTRCPGCAGTHLLAEDLRAVAQATAESMGLGEAASQGGA